MPVAAPSKADPEVRELSAKDDDAEGVSSAKDSVAAKSKDAVSKASPSSESPEKKSAQSSGDKPKPALAEASSASAKECEKDRESEKVKEAGADAETEEFEDIVDGEDVDDEDDEDFCIGDTVAHNEEDDLFDTTIGALQDIAISDEFQDIMNNFCKENCDIFEDTEENKLEYTALFQKWTVCIEKYLQEELEQQIEGFEMATFIEDLGKREHLLEEITEDVLELLVSCTDFSTFKDLMLHHKSQKDAKETFVLQGKKSELHQNEQEEGEERPDLDGFALGVASAVKK